MSTTADSRVVDIASTLIRCPSVTGPDAEIEAAAALDLILAKAPGVERRMVTAREGRPNLIATLRGREPGPSVLLTGHLDVVPADVGLWLHPPFEPCVVEGELWGRGSADMKGGLAALTVVFLEHAEEGGPPCGELVLAATADEEGEGRWGLPWLVAHGELAPDAAVIAEPSGLYADFDRVPVATRGSAFATISITGAGGHASFGTDAGMHAVAVACRAQQALEAEFAPSPAEHWAFPSGPTVVAGENFRGGERLGELPRSAEFTVSCRLLPGAVRKDFLPELTAFLEPLIPDSCDFTIALDEQLQSWAPGMSLDPAHFLAETALDAVRRAGYRDARAGGFPAFSEGTFLAKIGVPTLPALGPGTLARAHRPDERVAVAALEASVAIYRDIIGAVLMPASRRSPAGENG